MIAGTLEIQLLANMARLQKDMDDAKSVVGNAMKSIETAVGYAKTALVAFAGVATFDAFKGMIKGSIEATAGLHDMAIQTGASVAALGAFRSVASTTSTSIEGIAGAMNKMAKVMAGAGEDSKGAGQAVKSLGLDFVALKGMKPEDQMLAVAKAMDGFQDGAGKSAVAMTLFGKEGAKMLPFLKDLADESDAVAAKMTEQQVAAKAAQAAMADDYGDNLIKIQKASDAWRKDLAMGMLPALYEATQAFRDVTTGVGGVKEGISKLSADGSIAEWTRSAITGVTYVMDVFEGLKAVVVSVGHFIGAAAAQLIDKFGTAGEILGKIFSGDFSGASKAYADATARQTSMQADLRTQLDATWGAQTFGAKLRDRMDQLKGVAAAAKEVKPDLEFNAPTDKAGADRVTDYQKLTRAIAEKTAVAALDTETQARMTEGQKYAAKFEADLLIPNTLKMTGAEIELTRTRLAGLVAAELANVEKDRTIKAYVAASAAHDKYIESLGKGLEKLEADSKAQQDANDRMGLGKEAIAALDAANLELQATKLDGLAIDQLVSQQDTIAYEALKAQAAELRKLATLKGQGAAKEAALDAAKASAEEWKKGWEETDKLARDAFTGWAENGVSMADAIGKALKKSLLSAIYEATIKPVAFQIYSSITGGPSGSAASSFGSSYAANAAGAAAGGVFASNAAYGAAIGTTSIGAGSQAAMLAEQTGAFGLEGATMTAAAAGSGAMAAIGSAIPYIGAAIAVASLLNNPGDGHSTQSWGGAGYKIDGTRATNDAGSQAAVTAVQDQYKTLATSLGLANTEMMAGVFASYHTGAQSLMQVQASVGGKDIFSAEGLGSDGRAAHQGDQAAFAKELQQHIDMLLINALKSQTDIGADVMTKLGMATLDTAADVLGAVKAMQKLSDETKTLNTAAKALAAEGLKTLLENAAKATDSAMAAATRAISEQKTRLGLIRDAAAESVDAIGGVFGLLKDQISELYGTVDSTRTMQSAQGSAFIEQALATAQATGYLPDQQQLADAITGARAGLDANNYASQFEADKASLVLAGKLSQLQGISSSQLTTAEKQLRAATDQLTALDDALAVYKAQVDVLRGIDTGVGSVAQAIGALTDAMTVESAAAGKSAASAATTGSSAVDFGRGADVPVTSQAVDFAGIDRALSVNDFGANKTNAAYNLYVAASSAGASQADLAARYGYPLQDIQALFSGAGIGSFDVGTNYVPRDMLAMIHEGEEITPKAYNPAAGGVRPGGGNERLERLVEGLTAEVQRLQAIVASGNESTRQLADQFDNVTEGGNATRTVAV